MVAALSATMPDAVTWIEPKGGHILWLTLPRAGDEVFRAALDAGIAYTPGTAFHLDGQGAEHVALSFAGMSSARIEEGIAHLGTIIRRQLRGTRDDRPGADRRTQRRARRSAGSQGRS